MGNSSFWAHGQHFRGEGIFDRLQPAGLVVEVAQRVTASSGNERLAEGGHAAHETVIPLLKSMQAGRLEPGNVFAFAW
jgi:hypothetical protein